MKQIKMNPILFVWKTLSLTVVFLHLRHIEGNDKVTLPPDKTTTSSITTTKTKQMPSKQT
jgi:hypothetical protein